ncbi:LLM class flavin-dependent oxidoreductase [Streptomyces atratus]|uniref:LLM class flavin-dependent oxidoreductase n=1 Tax=Streptomyces atratus TaxID=1893 RepID=UPI0033D20398
MPRSGSNGRTGRYPEDRKGARKLNASTRRRPATSGPWRPARTGRGRATVPGPSGSARGAVAAGAISRIRLTTTILLARLRANRALFAKSAATLDRLSDGRLVLGLAPGTREDDYNASGVDFLQRGKLFDALLERATRQWQDHGGIGPRPATAGGPRCCSAGSPSPPCGG